MDIVLKFRLFSKIHGEIGRPLQVPYFDQNPAFDSVDHQALWQTTRGFGALTFLLNLLKVLHEGNNVRINANEGLSDPS